MIFTLCYTQRHTGSSISSTELCYEVTLRVSEVFKYLSLAHFILCIYIAACSSKCCDWPAIKQCSLIWMDHPDGDCLRKWSWRLLYSALIRMVPSLAAETWFKKESQEYMYSIAFIALTQLVDWLICQVKKPKNLVTKLGSILQSFWAVGNNLTTVSTYPSIFWCSSEVRSQWQRG